MSNSKKIIKAIALIICGLAILFFSIFIFGEGVPDLNKSENVQLKTMFMLMIFAFSGWIFSFFRQKEGGLVLTFTGVLLAMNMFYQGGGRDTTAALIYGLPFLIPGLMLWWLGRTNK